MKSICLALVLVALSALSASAQAPTAYTITLNTGATATIPIAQWTCGQTPKIPATSAVNPGRVVIDDPAAPTTADCIYTDPGTGLLKSLPFSPASYTATATVTNSAGVSPLSATSLPFTRVGTVPGAPTGLRLARSSFIRRALRTLAA